MTALFIRRPVMTALVMIGILFFGAVSYTRLAVSDLPTVDFPTIQVNANLPGASPETMAAAVATPLEKQFSTIAGIDNMTSSSGLGSSSITIQFSLDRSIDAAAQDVPSAIGSQNVSMPTGTLWGLNKASTIKANGQLQNAQQFRQMVVAYRNGAPVHLDELGQVLDDVENNKVASWYNGDRAVVLAIQRQPGTNTVAVANGVKALIGSLRSQIPPSVDIHTLYDRSLSIEESVNDVKFTLMLTMFLIGTFAVMYLLGFSLDNLSLMALTLAVGFVVDDAIVMLENIVRHMEMGKDP